MVLSYIYQEDKSNQIIFKGGTALRLIYGSPRFSEDLNFSTNLLFQEVENFVNTLSKKITKEVPDFTFSLIYKGKEGVIYNIKYQPPDLNFPLNIRLDFHRIKKIENVEKNVLTTRFPVLIFPTVFHLSKKGILIEKLKCLSTRFKGRDIFDIWYLLSKGVEVKDIISRKKYIDNIKKFNDKDLILDLNKFLPITQRVILPELKSSLLSLIKNL